MGEFLAGGGGKLVVGEVGLGGFELLEEGAGFGSASLVDQGLESEGPESVVVGAGGESLPGGPFGFSRVAVKLGVAVVEGGGGDGDDDLGGGGVFRPGPFGVEVGEGFAANQFKGAAGVAVADVLAEEGPVGGDVELVDAGVAADGLGAAQGAAQVEDAVAEGFVFDAGFGPQGGGPPLAGGALGVGGEVGGELDDGPVVDGLAAGVDDGGSEDPYSDVAGWAGDVCLTLPRRSAW